MRGHRFLVIGASGFIGSRVSTYLRSGGYDVQGTQSGRSSPPLVPFNLLDGHIARCFDTHYWNAGQLCGIICACLSQIDLCRKESELSFKINVSQTIGLIRDLVHLNVKPIFISTSFVFDGRDGSYGEQAQRAPICEYGRQKALVEDFLLEHVPQALILRLDKVVDDHPHRKNMFGEWYTLIEEGTPIACIEEQVFSPTFVGDIAQAIELGCEHGLRGVFHVANPESFGRVTLAQHFVSKLGRPAEIVARPQSAFGFLDPRPAKTFLDSRKFTSTTGFGFTCMDTVLEHFIHNLHHR